MDVTASDINLAIKQKYSGEQWRVWFEVSQSTGYNSGRRADAVVMNIWPSKGFQINVFEVKVSRSDFMNEMKDLTKSKAIGKYADFFWLACPVGLIDKSEVPDNWGFMELTKGGLRIKKQAPAQAEPAPLDRGFAASLLRAGEDLTERKIENIAAERADKMIDKIKERAEQESDTRFQRLKSEHEKLSKWKSEFIEAFGEEPNLWAPPAKMAERIKLARSIEVGDFKGLRFQAQQLANTLKEIES